jgi:imidazole glycerol-phosphate synthase subunit HisH
LQDPSLKIPHMGWNRVRAIRPHPVLAGMGEADEFYFVHSYYPLPSAADDVLAECEYGIVFPAIIGRRNLIATQFHLEKSGPAGLRILKNFLSWPGEHA